VYHHSRQQPRRRLLRSPQLPTKILDRVADDDRVFGIIYTIDGGDDWADEKSWLKANPNWGVSVFADAVAQEAGEAMQMASKQPAFQQKHLNVWTNADHTWMNMQKWDGCADPALSEQKFDGQSCIIGMDLASKLDILAIIRLHWRDDPETKKRHYYAFGNYWIPEVAAERSSNSQYMGWAIDGRLHTCPGETNDFDVVEQHIRDLASRFEVQEVVHDPWQAHGIVTHLQDDGLTLTEIPQRTQFFSPAMKELEAAVCDGRLHHDGDPVLTWAISNVVCHRDANDNIFPRKERFENKIDPAVALLMAMNRAMTAEEQHTDYTIRVW